VLLVLHGTEEFLARDALHKLIDDPRFALNVERFDGPSADINAVRMACETMPFLSEARLVVVDGLPKPRREKSGSTASEESSADDGKGAKGKRGGKKPTATALAKEFAGALAQIGGDIPSTTTLAVIVDEELPKAHPLLAAAQEHGKLLTFTSPTGAALDTWIARRAKGENVRITPEATRLLATLAVGKLRLLASEVNKLATYVGPNGSIDARAVNLLVADSREARVFDLTDVIARGDRAAALSLLHELLDEGQAPLAIIALIARQVRVLALVKDLASRGARSPEIASAAGLPPFIVEKTVAQARRFTATQLDAAQRACLTIDTALKRSRVTPDLALDLLITEFGQDLRL